jgi:glutamine---fructose-6-phosphate transaminase (isomerizing)
MCGIVGAVAQRNILPVLVEGLKRLEYRGYDSCGVAFTVASGLDRLRSTERVADLELQVGRTQAHAGISHTRWATHGKPSTANAHPHWSSARVAIVHNGIIENYEALRPALLAKGYTFESQTDTEVVVHLIDSLYAGDLLAAVQAAAKQLHGAQERAPSLDWRARRFAFAAGFGRRGKRTLFSLRRDGAGGHDSPHCLLRRR